LLTGLAYPMTHVDGDTLLVELLYEQEARLDEGQLLAGVNKVLSRTVRAGYDGQPMLLASYGHPSDPARIDLSQTWGFPEARRVLDRCQAVLTIGERFGGPFLQRTGLMSSAPPSWRFAASPHRRRRGGLQPPSSCHRRHRLACR
jgi:hypothetical protein